MGVDNVNVVNLVMFTLVIFTGEMNHSLFEDVRARAEANQENILFSRVEGPSDIGEELGKIAQESVEETLR